MPPNSQIECYQVPNFVTAIVMPISQVTKLLKWTNQFTSTISTKKRMFTETWPKQFHLEFNMVVTMVVPARRTPVRLRPTPTQQLPRIVRMAVTASFLVSAVRMAWNAFHQRRWTGHLLLTRIAWLVQEERRWMFQGIRVFRRREIWLTSIASRRRMNQFTSEKRLKRLHRIENLLLNLR